MSNEDKALSTDQILREECKAIGRNFFPENAKQHKTLFETQKVLAMAEDGNTETAPLTALCLSGGGIRSATFNLGVVQELAKLDMLDKFDYLSTVSGGGYLGSWLSAWIQRDKLDKVVKELQTPNKVTPEEATQIRHLREYSNYLSPQKGLFSADTWTLIAIWLRNTLLNWLVLIPMLMAGLLLPRLFAYGLHSIPALLSDWWVYIAFGVSILFILIAAAYAGRNLPSDAAKNDKGKSKHLSLGEKPFLLYCLLPVMLAGLSATCVAWSCWWHSDLGAIPMLVTLGLPAFCLGLFALMSFCTAAFSLRDTTRDGDATREWSARASAWLLLLAVGWLVLCGLAIWGPWLLFEFHAKWQAIVAVSGVTGAISAILAKSASSAATKQAAQQLQREGKSPSWFLPAAALLFIVTFLSGLSLLAGYILNQFSPECADFLCRIASQNPFWLILVLSIASVFFGLFIQINKFSIHSLYRNRLMRAYLGASRKPCVQEDPGLAFFPPPSDSSCDDKQRKPNRFSGFDSSDNLYMKELVQKPFLVVNTALNLVHGRQLAWQDRKAEPFSISPLHAGSALMTQGQGAYRRVGEYTGNCGLTLATAISISGAAASPNMGYHSSPIMAFIMTLFNVRLGWWIGNPKLDSWKAAGPKAARFQLIREALGLTNDDGKWVYLSDGGHFENLGLYEMVLRRCRYIVVCDSGADPGFVYEDIGNAIHKIRVDLGVNITLNPGSSLPTGKRDSTAFCHHAHFKIHYSDLHEGAEDGVILYIKPAFYQAEANTPVDVFHYAQGSKDFPHETTADQFFGESQFESYRQLGKFTLSHFFKGFSGSSIKDLVNFVQSTQSAQEEA